MKKFGNLTDAIAYTLSDVYEFDVYTPMTTFNGMCYAGGIQELNNGYYVTDRDYQICVYTNEENNNETKRYRTMY